VPGQQRDPGRPAPWESGLVIVDKPGGMTSHDVVARIRRLAHTRRVGHAGTLDPMATGVLVIGVEKATRLLGHLMLTEKTYEATIRLGQSTSTDDAEGEPTGTALRPARQVTRGALEDEIAKLTGDILQVPASVSAIKVNGQRAYKLTRAGEAPELAARPVTVYEFRVTAVRADGDFRDVDATVRCSSGTYIRALARDLGAALGTGGHLTALRRTAVGPYTLAQAHTLEELEDQDRSAERLRLTPVAPTAPPSGLAEPAGPPADRATTSTREEGTAAGASPSGIAADGASPSRAAAGGAPPSGIAAEDASPSRAAAADASPARVVLPLADAAAAAFPRVDLAADEARRLAQGARLPLPPQGLPTAANAPGTPIAAFAPDGTLIALVTEEGGRLRSLAVFIDAAANARDT
jgi:tRNA pseudouridine55 synthase